MTDYLEKFIVKQIEFYIPKGIDKHTHVNSRAYMYDIISELIENKEIPIKLGSIKYLCLNYKSIIETKLSVLN